MTEYSVQTTNRFALGIEDDEDPHEILEQQLAEKKRKAELAAEQATQAKLNLANNKGKIDKKNSGKTSAKRNVKPTANSNVPFKTNTRNDGKESSMIFILKVYCMFYFVLNLIL